MYYFSKLNWVTVAMCSRTQKSNVTCDFCYRYIEYYNFNTVLSFLKMCIHFLAPSVYIYIYIYIYTHTQSLSKRFEQHLLWPPRSPDLTPCDFFLWGYVKDNAYKPPLPQNVRELQDRIRAAVQTIDENMLKRVWQERLSY